MSKITINLGPMSPSQRSSTLSLLVNGELIGKPVLGQGANTFNMVLAALEAVGAKATVKLMERQENGTDEPLLEKIM